MNTVLVWVLITCTDVHGGCQMTYSPPVVDLASCQRIRDNTSVPVIWKKCVQVWIYTK